MMRDEEDGTEILDRLFASLDVALDKARRLTPDFDAQKPSAEDPRASEPQSGRGVRQDIHQLKSEALRDRAALDARIETLQELQAELDALEPLVKPPELNLAGAVHAAEQIALGARPAPELPPIVETDVRAELLAASDAMGRTIAELRAMIARVERVRTTARKLARRRRVTPRVVFATMIGSVGFDAMRLICDDDLNDGSPLPEALAAVYAHLSVAGGELVRDAAGDFQDGALKGDWFRTVVAFRAARREAATQ
jgi:hypothetical protein